MHLKYSPYLLRISAKIFKEELTGYDDRRLLLNKMGEGGVNETKLP